MPQTRKQPKDEDLLLKSDIPAVIMNTVVHAFLFQLSFSSNCPKTTFWAFISTFVDAFKRRHGQEQLYCYPQFLAEVLTGVLGRDFSQNHTNKSNSARMYKRSHKKELDKHFENGKLRVEHIQSLNCCEEAPPLVSYFDERFGKWMLENPKRHESLWIVYLNGIRDFDDLERQDGYPYSFLRRHLGN